LAKPTAGKVSGMTPTRQGSFRLFRLAGIDVFLHWSWFLIAAYQLSYRLRDYSTPFWSVLEYLTLFAIVLTHEFGHSLACRQVGGRANQIVLWPLGGVAYVSPPPRPGAMLWSIAAGPLVNVALIPILFALMALGKSMGASRDLTHFIREINTINFYLLAFNLLPIYPLDGGQILRSLLWFGLGRGRSLLVASIVGLLGVAGLVVLAVRMQSIWFGVFCAFIFLNCWRGLAEARALLQVAGAPRHEGFACPSCRMAPPRLSLWICGNCEKAFDIFAGHGTCPNCGAHFDRMQCLECGAAHPMNEWVVARSGPPPLPPRA